MKDYIKIARPDHWIKNLFIFPGTLFALMLTTQGTKLVGLGGSAYINTPFLICEIFLLAMGVVYNVAPLRTKDIAYLDVLSESVNNAIRLLLGWFLVAPDYLPPTTIVLGYWLGGAFLMAVKRFAEFRMFKNREEAALYRKSFGHYTEQTLLCSAFFYAMCSLFLCGIFIIKYKIELLLVVPFLCGLFCYYFFLAFKADSVVQKPEKLYREKGLVLYVVALAAVFLLALYVKIPALSVFLDCAIIRM